MQVSNLAVIRDEFIPSFTTPASGCGISSESGVYETMMMDFPESAITWSREQTLLRSLREVFKECSKENWNGYDAKPISVDACAEAKKLIECLPMTLPMPEIVPEPTGEIALEWYKDKQSVFVISVSGNNVITYAGLFGKGNETHGTEFFVDALPMVIISSIQRLYRVA